MRAKSANTRAGITTTRKHPKKEVAVKRLDCEKHNMPSRSSPADAAMGHCVTLPPEFAGDAFLWLARA